MRDVEHDIVGSPVFDEGLQLVFYILRLLSGETRYREVSTIALAGRPVAIKAVFHLGFDGAVGGG